MEETLLVCQPRIDVAAVIESWSTLGQTLTAFAVLSDAAHLLTSFQYQQPIAGWPVPQTLQSKTAQCH